MKYYEHYLKRLRQSIARTPMAEHLLPLLDLFDDRPVEERFEMIQELERLVRDLGAQDVDWAAGTEIVRKAAAESRDAAEFRDRLRKIAGQA